MKDDNEDDAANRGHRGRRAALIGIVGVLFEAAALKLRAGKFAGTVAVRCRQGHLFTTLWIPGVSVKSLRLGFWRFQHCPVGKHWSIVTPLKDSTLTPEELRAAHELRTAPIP